MSSSSEQHSRFKTALEEAQRVLAALENLAPALDTAAEWCIEALKTRHKILAFGNGGSACEAQHLAGELMGRYKRNRRPLPAVALNADTAVLTCIGNDFTYDDIFARQVEGLGAPGDLVIAFSTSGNSPNVLRALETARRLTLRSISFLGREGGAAAELSDCALVVPHQDTARIQEGHNFLMHSLMDRIEDKLG